MIFNLIFELWIFVHLCKILMYKNMQNAYNICVKDRK